MNMYKNVQLFIDRQAFFVIEYIIGKDGIR